MVANADSIRNYNNKIYITVPGEIFLLLFVQVSKIFRKTIQMAKKIMDFDVYLDYKILNCKVDSKLFIVNAFPVFLKNFWTTRKNQKP